MRIATFNVNSIGQRIEPLKQWIAEREPDIVCLQELKCVNEAFPRAVCEELGYNIAVHGQKSYNGVAVLSRHRIDEVSTILPGAAGDDQARYLEAVISIKRGVLRVASLYLPNGNPPKSDKFRYKLAWMDRLLAHARERLDFEEPLVLAGDFNVIPTERDARYPERWTDDALFQPESRAKFQALTHLGFTDAVRAASDDPGLFTFWDYQAGAWQKNNGIRIDHLLLSPQAADRLTACGIDKAMRGRLKPSDHVPVWVDLAIDAG
jgi:exodeoxyribonuclease-3